MSENQTETPVADTLNDERARRLADREALYAAGQMGCGFIIDTGGERCYK